MNKAEFFGRTALLMYNIPFSPEEFKDPSEVQFKDLEKRNRIIIDTLWKYKEQLDPELAKSLPIYVASLRMIVMYLNMSEAFFSCGEEFMMSAINEADFVRKYQDLESRLIINRASNLLARTVVLLRNLGFKGSLISIDSDLHHYERCEETKEWLNAVSSHKDTGNKGITGGNQSSGN